jgi:hypothetical protein
MKNVIVALWLTIASFAFAQNPQTQGPLYAANAKYVNGTAPGYMPCGAIGGTAGLNCSGTSGLNVSVGPGTVNCSGTVVQYSGGTLALTASSTNYVYLNTASSCAVAVKTSAFGSTDIPIAVIVAGPSTITSITDDRTQFSVPSASESGITQLTGDGTAGPGSGSQSLTLATVNSSPGTCGDATHVCQVTTDGKGLTTAQSAVAITSGSGIETAPATTQTILSSTSGVVPLQIATNNGGSSNVFTVDSTFSPGTGNAIKVDANNNVSLASGIYLPYTSNEICAETECFDYLSLSNLSAHLHGYGSVLIDSAQSGNDINLVAGGTGSVGNQVKIQNSYQIVSVNADGDVVALVSGTDNGVSDVTISGTNAIGVQVAHSGTVSGVLETGNATVNLDGTSSLLVGDRVCTSPTTAGKGHDNGTSACTTQQIGFVIVAGTSTVTAQIYLQIQAPGGSSGAAAWGSITGTLPAQTDLAAKFATYTPTSGLAASATTDTTNASNITSGTLPHARLPTLLSADIPNNAANTTGTSAALSVASALPNATTATTQTVGDNTAAVSTDAFVATAVAAKAAVTSIATTTPITGGTITTTGTIGCATCATATSLGTGIAHVTSGSQALSSSAVNLAGGDVTGLLPNTNLANSSTTVNGQTCILGSTCNIPIQTASANNASLGGVNFITSTTNTDGLVCTFSNPSTNQVKCEITGVYNGAAATVPWTGVTGGGANTVTTASSTAATWQFLGTSSASTPALQVSGTPYAGTTANSFGLFDIACGTPSALTNLTASGTAFTIRCASGFAGSIATWYVGNTIEYMFSAAGALTVAGTISAGSSSKGLYFLANAPKTTVSCYTSGTAVFAMPQQGTGDMKVKAFLSSCVGTASYTFPTAFTQTPSIVTTNEVAGSIVTSLSTTTMTVTGATTTGFLVLEGW